MSVPRSAPNQAVCGSGGVAIIGGKAEIVTPHLNGVDVACHGQGTRQNPKHHGDTEKKRQQDKGHEESNRQEEGKEAIGNRHEKLPILPCASCLGLSWHAEPHLPGG